MLLVAAAGLRNRQNEGLLQFLMAGETGWYREAQALAPELGGGFFYVKISKKGGSRVESDLEKPALAASWSKIGNRVFLHFDRPRTRDAVNPDKETI